jgi:hypothetical protein
VSKGQSGEALGGVVEGATGSAAVGDTIGAVQDDGELPGEATEIVKGVAETVADTAI